MVRIRNMLNRRARSCSSLSSTSRRSRVERVSSPDFAELRADSFRGPDSFRGLRSEGRVFSRCGRWRRDAESSDRGFDSRGFDSRVGLRSGLDSRDGASSLAPRPRELLAFSEARSVSDRESDPCFFSGASGTIPDPQAESSDVGSGSPKEPSAFSDVVGRAPSRDRRLLTGFRRTVPISCCRSWSRPRFVYRSFESGRRLRRGRGRGGLDFRGIS